MASAGRGSEPARGACRQDDEILALTSLRGLAASCVVIFHMNYAFYLHYWHHDPGIILRTIFRVGYLNVDLFFVLSGYVITRAYLAWFHRPTLGGYLVFLSRRLARIWPLHLLTLLLFIGAADCSGTATLVSNLAMVHAWGFIDHYSCNYPSWSISCEWFVYMIFPCLAWLMMPVTDIRLAFLLVVAALGGLGALSYLEPSHTLDVTYELGPVRALCSFVIGGALCRAFAKVRPSAVFDGLALLLAAGAAALAASGAYDFWVVSLFGPLVVSLSLAAGPVKRILSLGPAVWLGEISYSMYLLHHFLIEHLREQHVDLGTPFRVLLTLAMIMAFSSVSYIWIEKPARQMLQRSLARFLSPMRDEAARSGAHARRRASRAGGAGILPAAPARTGRRSARDA